MGKNIAVYAGSFNPFTKGHLSVVEEASKLFDTVYVCIATNSEKKSKQFFNMDDVIAESVEEAGLSNVNVAIIEGTLVADFCKTVGANYLVRALRNTSDYMYEENIAKINHEINPDLVTIYFRARPEYEAISSSMVRELYKYGKDVTPYLPRAVGKLFK